MAERRIGPTGIPQMGDPNGGDPADITVPDFKVGADEGDRAAVVWPEYDEGLESINTRLMTPTGLKMMQRRM